MSFNDLNDQFQALADKYGLTPGFQGDYDLRSIFGDLVDDQSFVRDRKYFQIGEYSMAFVAEWRPLKNFQANQIRVSIEKCALTISSFSTKDSYLISSSCSIF